ncbi:hypothetical protein DFH08DRAFT_949516 [Mycena albidolilacea]|uniref:Uncharacterized protein n=1 Tax=Mycena albidolilacea TaxID=1033008 RepID=A0AAD7AN06_9AGAR|nr:hypothetical protein DFH08DRAFT_949516 [Mycena albidolilacea]
MAYNKICRTVAQAMVLGYQHAGYKGHHSYTSCVVEWQAHCALGVHPHPVDPQTSKEKVLATHGKVRRRSSLTPAPHRSSGVKAVPRGSALRTPRYYAIWGGEVVYSTKYAVRSAFKDAVEEGGELELLSTGDFEVALAYAERDANDALPSTTPTPPANASLLPEGTSTTTVPNTTNPSDALPNANPTSSTTVPGTTATANAPPNTTSTGVASLALPSTAAGTAAPDASLTTLPPGSLISDKGEEYTPVERPVIVKRVHEKKGRCKPREEPGKPGRVSWVWGTKLTFFEKRKGDFVTAFEKKVTGDFYTKMTRLYTVKYGRGLADDEDFEFDVADPPDWVANKVVNERLTPEETKFRNEWHSKFRDRVGNWYRTQYQSLLKEDKTTFSEIFGHLGEGPRRPPRRPQLLHFYSEKRYDSHIKPLVEARKRTLAKREALGGMKAPAAIVIQNEVTKECWDEEPLSVQEEVVRERERDHDNRVKAWKESNADGPNRTPEEFSASLKSAAHYLQPFVDVIAE